MAKPDSEFLKDAIFLIDASSYIFRAYYGIQSQLKAPDGTPTHATFGFLQMLQALLTQHKVQKVALIWDRKEKGFRHELFSEYKANRAIPPEDLGLQIENSKKLVDLLGIPQLDHIGFEADDIIATFVAQNPNRPLIIVTGDKDLLQLVGPHVWCLDTLKNQWSNIAEAKEKFGVEPKKISEVQALCGDSVDNVPGVPGVGPKTAAELILHFGSLSAVLIRANELKSSPELLKKGDGPLKGKRLESVIEHSAMAELSLKLVHLRDDVPIDVTPEHYEIKQVKLEELKLFAAQLGFSKVVQRLTGHNMELSTSEKKADEPLNTSVDSPEKEAQPELPFEVVTVKTRDEFKALLSQALRYSVLALDTETRHLESRREKNLVGISFCFDGQKSYYLPLRHDKQNGTDIEHGGEGAVRDYLNLLQEHIHERAKMKLNILFHNAKFDCHVLASESITFPFDALIQDTMVESFVADVGERHGMDALAQKYLDGYTPLSFESVLAEGPFENFSQVSIERATFYSAEDAWVTWSLYGVLTKKLREENLWPVYDLLDRKLIPVLTRIEEAGIYFDLTVVAELSKSFHEELTAKQEEAVVLLKNSGINVSPTFNLASTKQIAQVLFEELKLPVIKKGKTGPSTDVEVLEELSSQHPFPAKLLEIREISKLLSTYIDAFPELIDTKTTRLHTDFSQTIAATGRLSSSNPNLQNIPIRTQRGRKIRDAFQAAKGYRLIGADYSQIELRILAEISADENLMKAFHDDADIHRRTAALILKKKEADVTDDDRRMAKTINFGIVYGQTAFGLAKTLGISRTQAQLFIDEYFNTYPGIRNYMDKIIASVNEDAFVCTSIGRKRKLPDIHSKNPTLRNLAERMAINSPIQGTAADLMKAAMIEVDRFLFEEKLDARLVLQVHDEILIEARAEIVSSLMPKIASILENPQLLKEFKVEPFKVPLKVSISEGQHWGEL